MSWWLLHSCGPPAKGVKIRGFSEHETRQRESREWYVSNVTVVGWLSLVYRIHLAHWVPLSSGYCCRTGLVLPLWYLLGSLEPLTCCPEAFLRFHLAPALFTCRRAWITFPSPSREASCSLWSLVQITYPVHHVWTWRVWLLEGSLISRFQGCHPVDP